MILPNRTDAIVILCPNTTFSTDDNGNITSWDIGSAKSGADQPTEADIDAKLIELESEWAAQEYARNRASAFPSIGDQMDMQYHDLLNSTTTWKDAIAKVKADNPKE